MKKWKMGIVGAGVIADFHAKAIHEIERAELVCVCDIDPQKALDFAGRYHCQSYSTVNEMLEKADLDIVSIATPSGLHMEPAIAAAEKSVHCIVEKPLEISVERIAQIIAAHEKSGTRLGCIFQTRYADAMVPLRDAINEGRFGQITFAGVFVPWWRSDDYYKDSWHGTWEFDGGGALMNQAIHMIDTLCELMPEVESVQAFKNSIGHPDIEAEDTAVAVLRFRSGALGLVHGSTACYPGQPKRLEIMGTGGTVIYVEDSYTVFDFREKLPRDDDFLKRFGQMNYKSGFNDPKAISHSLHTACFRDFIDSIENNRQFKIDGREAKKSVKLIESIYKSAKEEKLICLQ